MLPNKLASNNKETEQKEYRDVGIKVTEITSRFSVCGIQLTIRFLNSIKRMKGKPNDLVRSCNKIIDQLITVFLKKDIAKWRTVKLL